MSISTVYSYSKINLYGTCPEKYKITYIDKIRRPDESIEAFMGNRVHEVLEWVYKYRANKFTTFDKLTEKYDELWCSAWHEKIFIADPRINTNHIYTMGLRCLGNFCSKYGPMFSDPVYATELKLEFEIGNYKFRGVLDRVDEADKNNLVITDYKTGKKAKGSIAARSDLQLGLYYIAIKQNFENKDRIFTGWNFLRHSKEAYYEHTKESIVKVKKKIIKKVNLIEDHMDKGETFFPKESILCHWCYYWDKCSVKNVLNPARSAT